MEDLVQITYTTTEGTTLLITYSDGLITVEEIGRDELEITEKDG